jgi:hypothetical protein
MLSLYFVGRTEEIPEKKKNLRIFDILAEIQIEHLPNTSPRVLPC